MQKAFQREINSVVIHCSDSDYPQHDNVETIRKWHVTERKWSDIGYHIIITKDGTIHTCRPMNRRGAHCAGYNQFSVGICLTGRYEFSDAQKASLKQVLKLLKSCYNLENRNIYGHKQLTVKKTCPNFDIKEVMP